MSDFSSQNSQINPSSAFSAALLRAKQIAAKIHPGGQTGKRSIDDSSSEPETKKFIGSDYNNANSPPSGMSQAAMAQAAAVAARLAQNPNNSANNNTDPVQRAREIINKMVNQGNGQMDQNNGNQGGGGGGGGGGRGHPGLGSNNYSAYQEIMIPGAKVGLIIGKGGETIKQLQEKTGAKMVIIQDGPGQEMEKPLRISGDPQKVEHAKSLVYELLQEKDPFINNVRPNHNGGEQAEVFVPKAAVGVVIGKGGDMIKKIQGETGCKLQFIQGRGDGPGDRRCIVQGTKQQVDDGKQMIEDLIDSVLRRGGQGGGGGSQGGNNSNPNGENYSNYVGPSVVREEYTFTVPASKCGIIIGRGGDTIKQINQQSGAYCEMDRKASANQTTEKTFTVKGEQHQIDEAKRLISEKINIELTLVHVGSQTVPANQGYGNQHNQNNGQQYQQQWGYTPQWDQQQGQPGAVAVQQGQAQGDYSQQWIDYYKQMGMHREADMIEQQIKARQQGQAQAAQQAMVPGAANGVQASPVMQMQNQGGDYSTEWAEYYRRIGKNDEAEAIEKQIQANKAMQASAHAQLAYGSQQQYQQYYGAAGGQPGYPGYPYYPAQPQAPQQQQQQQQQQPQQPAPGSDKK